MNMIKIFGIIRSLLTWPFRMIFYALGVPNIKVVYHSGHVEYYYFKIIKLDYNRSDGHITEVAWETVGGKRPVHLNMHRIESVVEIY